MNLIKILKESFIFLRKYPKFFIPRLISVTIWIVFYILLLETLTSITFSNYISKLAGSIFPLGIMILIFSPISVIIYSMYPTLVKSYKRKGLFSFKKSLKTAIKKFPKAFVVIVLPVLIMTFLATPFAGIALIGYIKDVISYMIIGIISTIFIIIIFSIMFYFAPSSIIIKDIGAINSLKESWSLGKNNFKEIGIITVFSFSILVLGYLIPGSFKFAGIIGFVVGRYLQGIIGTYLIIVNPNLYLGLTYSHN